MSSYHFGRSAGGPEGANQAQERRSEPGVVIRESRALSATASTLRSVMRISEVPEPILASIEMIPDPGARILHLKSCCHRSTVEERLRHPYLLERRWAGATLRDGGGG